MSKVRNFSEIAPNIAFPEFNFYELYYSTFEKNELGRIKELLPLREMADNFGLVRKSMRPKLGRKSFSTPEGKVALMFLKMYTGLSCPKLMEQLNDNIHYQIFCDVIIDPTRPLTNYNLLGDCDGNLVRDTERALRSPKGQGQDEADGIPVYLLRHPHGKRGAVGDKIEQRSCLAAWHGNMHSMWSSELYHCHEKQTKNPTETTGERYSIEFLMSRTHKLNGIVCCFAQVENIKRQFLSYEFIKPLMQCNIMLSVLMPTNRQRR